MNPRAPYSFPDFESLIEQLRAYAEYKSDRASRRVDKTLHNAHRQLSFALQDLQNLEEEAEMAACEPNDLDTIKALSPTNKPFQIVPPSLELYKEKVKGAFLARAAGCILGAIVEGWPVQDIQHWARRCGVAFPPTDYWPLIRKPYDLRFLTNERWEYTRPAMKAMPVDDDIAYTQLGLLIVEEFGFEFTTEDVAAAWKRYLPVAYTAEAVALDNLKQGLPPDEAAITRNPYVQWIGAQIRADAWGYLCPGNPELASELAWRDARLSHERNGMYGEMLYAAAIAAAFVLDDPIEAVRIGLQQVPRDSRLAQEMQWALEVGPTLHSYDDARAAVDERFPGMHRVHVLNNACLTLFALFVGGGDISKTISESVAMGLDNDCNAATAGSIVGAICGFEAVEEKWYEPFNGRSLSYLNGIREFDIDDLVARFAKIAITK
jgi:ADP-ribosylglycohydrolase